MLKTLPTAAFILALSLSGCYTKSEEPDHSKVLAHNDFDEFIGWVDNVQGLATLSKAQAHSGQYSTTVYPGIDYSLGYNSALGKLVDHRPEKLVISAWVMVPNDRVDARLVVEVKDLGPPQNVLLYDATELRTVVKKLNAWQRVEKTITLPPAATVTTNLLVYMHRANSTEAVYLDDMQISLAK